MPPDGPLVNIGELSKPATVLVEKICNAVGVLYEPTRMRRLARAEADAEKIKALAKIELSQIEERAIERLLYQEARKQDNIEQIAAQAASQLPPNADVASMDEDWIAHLFKQCDTVSDKQMQSLWSGLLAGEATKPGSFSKRTVDFVSSMDKQDAALFTALGQFVWQLGDPVPLIYELDSAVYAKHGINFVSLKHLDAIGLISFESVAGYQLGKFSNALVLHYYGTPTRIDFKQDKDNVLQVGHALLTTIGKELVRICGSARNEEWYQWVLNRWRGEGLVVNGVGLAPST